MKAQQGGPAETPKLVWTALWVNLVLVLIALGAPRLVPTSDSAVLLFVIPMVLILAIGVGAAIRAYILADREKQSMRWTAFLPLAVFLLGMGGTLMLIYADLA